MEDSSKGERILSKVTIEGMALSKKGISLPATGGKEEKKVCRYSVVSKQDYQVQELFQFLKISQLILSAHIVKE